MLITLVAGCATQPAYQAKPLPQQCTTECKTPYGMVLGKTEHEVVAYSNCTNHCFVFSPNFQNGTYTGIQWQCVEFARRWLLQEKGMVFGDVDFAIDIWDKIQSYTRISDGRKIPVTAHLNGAHTSPQIGDLLIYAKSLYGTGHVAVVTGIDPEAGKLHVAEQNYQNVAWTTGFAREIEFIKKADSYWILDPYLIGWKRAENSL